MNNETGRSDTQAKARLHLDQAYKWYKKEAFEKALDETDAAIDSAPGLAEAHNLRGLILEELNRKVEAMAAYAEAVRLDPGFDEARENLGELETEVREDPEVQMVPTVESTELRRRAPFDLSTFEKGMELARSKQNLGLGILGGVVAAGISAVIWAGITVASEFQIGWMAIGVGFFVGYAIRSSGKAIDTRFRVAGATLALLGCLAGNVLTGTIFLSQEFDVPILDLLISLNTGVVFNILLDGFNLVDLLFYGLAIYEGYRFSVRRVTLAEVDELVLESPPYRPPTAAKYTPSYLPAALVLGGLLAGGFTAAFLLRQVRGDFFGAWAHNLRGVELSEQGKLDQALEEYQTATRLYPRFSTAHENLGWTYYYQGEYDQAAETFQEALGLGANSADVYDGLGWSYFNQGDLEKATGAFQEALGLDPNNPDVYDGLGWIYYFQGEFNQAAEAFENAISFSPSLFEAYVGLGRSQLELDQPAEAVGTFQEAIRIDPGQASPYEGLGDAYFALDNLDEAVSAYQEAAALDPTLVSARVSLGLVLDLRGDFAEAVEQLERVAQLEPEWNGAQAFLAHLYYNLDRPEEMEQALQAATPIPAGDVLSRVMLSMVYSELHQFSEAGTQLLEAIEYMPDAGSFYSALASAYSAQRNFDEALRVVDRALTAGLDPVDVHVARSEVYVRQEDLDLALEELTRALELASEDDRVHSSLSNVYFHQGQSALALSEAEEAIRLQPYNQEGHALLAFAKDSLGQPESALASAQEAVRLSPKWDTAHYILGLCYMNLGENEKAAAEFEQFLELYWDRAYVRDYKVKAETYLSQLQ